ncbi:helix-turn-helix domain-containing protein [Bradyrhizobium erythrophlei]|uniref:helix-turn-helix domain-containing protein n=1 Tax=Bradyrhizobium erythrophlei TaxID=1437360 RepID=UPI0009A8DA7D|nr:helix-turn-helix domain-containing protein [Bradyrhizobium erythrophlei]
MRDKLGVDVATFAADHGLSETTVYKEINEGRLAAAKVGRRTIIFWDAGEAWRRSCPPYAAKNFAA